MIIGNASIFAIESKISQVYNNLSLRGLGYFVIYINNKRYGVYSNDATALACSFDAVTERIAMKGKHTAPFAFEKDPAAIANSVKYALYADVKEDEKFFNISLNEFTNILYTNKIIWAPDGDEAFDDGSYVLHFDVEDQVRLVGFKCMNDYNCDLNTLSEIWLEANNFYDILIKWRDGFIDEWETKISYLDNEA